ncbi:MAG: R3H domain-containing nucleic acid-binding protein, partial [Anaerolineales bacterium]
LIGRRGETLSALQYITRLIVGKELKQPVAVVIDVEGYRARRERQLRMLARKMAEQAIETGRTTTLEPMPANERRIIHIELRENPNVDTESIGEGDRRKVTVIPQRQDR